MIDMTLSLVQVVCADAAFGAVRNVKTCLCRMHGVVSVATIVRELFETRPWLPDHGSIQITASALR